MSKSSTTASKGELTRACILDAAVQQAALAGFEALTIGGLASQTGLSKSGLFAHFGSKEELQLAALDEVVRRFIETAYQPALAAPAGRARLLALFAHWLQWTKRSGLPACPMMSALGEYDSQPGPMRNALEREMRRLDAAIADNVATAIALGEFSGAVTPQQFAFETFGIIASCYRSRILYQDPESGTQAQLAFTRLLAAAAGEAPAGTVAPATVRP